MTVDPVAFYLGPFPVRWYGILIASAIVIGTWLAQREAVRQRADPDRIVNLVLGTVPLALLGARAYYVIFNWFLYRKDLTEIFKIWHGGLAIHGGLITGVVMGYLLTKKLSLDFWQTGDILAPSIILGQAIGRWGNFFNQEAYGYPTDLPWAMYIDGAYRHPTFLYESLWDLVVFLLLVWYRRRKELPKGRILLLYIGMYSVGRFFVEGFRTDSLTLGPFRAAQVVSVLAVVMAGLVFLLREKTKN